MKSTILAILLLGWAAVCPAAPAIRSAADAQRSAPSWPHSAVARVVAPERGGNTLGSGTLVGKDATLGLVVTNWHVVRDATGPVLVIFPDGFRSYGEVLKLDRVWDLAVLVIRPPHVQPVPLSASVPKPGEVLTIAGYGGGQYRAVQGRCTQYVSPGNRQPAEMLQLGVAARKGDSGGPIFNNQSQLAGVLWGAGQGQTTGTYCGRVARFLTALDRTSLERGLARVPDLGGDLAQAQPSGTPAAPPFSLPMDAASTSEPPAPVSASVMPPADDLFDAWWGDNWIEHAKAVLALFGAISLAGSVLRGLTVQG